MASGGSLMLPVASSGHPSHPPAPAAGLPAPSPAADGRQSCTHRISCHPYCGGPPGCSDMPCKHTHGDAEVYEGGLCGNFRLVVWVAAVDPKKSEARVGQECAHGGDNQAPWTSLQKELPRGSAPAKQRGQPQHCTAHATALRADAQDLTETDLQHVAAAWWRCYAAV